MSTLATNAITDASGGNTATINSYTPTESNMAGRNRIINGDMRIDQRNAGASISVGSSPVYPVDRFQVRIAQGSGHTTQRSTTAPAGFTNSILTTVGTGAAPTSGQVSILNQQIEGFNFADFGWGSAGAQSVTISFQVRSSVTGTFCVAVSNSGLDRSYVTTFTISAANTYETKQITIPGDTSGTWLKDNGIGAFVFFDLGSGTSREATAADAWEAGWKTRTSGSTILAATSGATFYITGVQLEAGSVATPFERRPYGQELQLAQRYAWICSQFIGSPISGSNLATPAVPYPVQMRAAPTLETGASFIVNTGSAGTPAIFIGTGSPASPNSQYIYNNGSNWTINATVQLNATFTAEL
jgi:hypothetical protein